MMPPASRAPRPRLTATYRVQLNHTFTLRDAVAIVPYLHSLGISHLYCSPILAARRGSMHGYDVADPTRLNPELGTEDDLRALANALHERGMGIIIDIVPNHMGVGPDNPFWQDVLTHGEHSPYARWFDIEWDAGHTAPGAHAGKVVLPILGDELDAVLERGEIRLDVGDSHKRITYFQQSFPLDPATLTPEIQLALWDPEAVGDPNAFLASTEGREGLRKLLEAQHYRLTFWRHADTELNYRRFFDVNELIALRMEDPAVFAETHELILRWVREGVIDGLRVDHIDGLRDPAAYVARLRKETGLRSQESLTPDSSSTESFPIFVEKILSPGEQLPGDWPVSGTTGYEFLNDLEDCFIEPHGFEQIEACYRRLRRLPAGTTFADTAYAAKVALLQSALHPDVARVARRLQPLARAAGHKDWDRDRLVHGVVHFIAAMPVYRTYLDGTGAPNAQDRAVIERAAAEATRRQPDAADVVRLVRDVLLENAGRAGAGDAAWLEFVQRLQQTSGPAAAKGVEDTALYQYVPLASRNEVGGAPDRSLANTVSRLHDANARRRDRWPQALLCTNTHDTKRSADLRARLDAISAVPREWQRHMLRWRRLNSRHRSIVKGRVAPDINAEYLFYQTLLGLWPAPRAGRRVDDLPDRAWRDAAKERLEQYMLKAVREAKLRTSWVDQNADYEDALKHFIAGVLEPREDAPFLPDVARFASELSASAFATALSRVLVHLTAPGTPDLYQGDELWNVALVDPDNRRPVDYRARAAQLSHEHPAPRDLVGMKLAVTHSLLSARREHPELFREGEYRPLSVEGSEGAHVIAYARSHGNTHALVVATRLLRSLKRSHGSELLDWGSTVVALPEGLRGRRWRSVFDGQELAVEPGAVHVPASLILNTMPVALLLSPG